MQLTKCHIISCRMLETDKVAICQLHLNIQIPPTHVIHLCSIEPYLVNKSKLKVLINHKCHFRYSGRSKIQECNKPTCQPLFSRNCLKSDNFRSPTRTGLWGGGFDDGGSRISFSSSFPTSASTQAISCSPNCSPC